MKILVEGLVDIFLSLFYENKAKDLRTLDANGFCQLMLEVSYVLPLIHINCRRLSTKLVELCAKSVSINLGRRE